MELLWVLEASMMALEMMGPTKSLVKTAGGAEEVEEGEEEEFFAARCHLRDLNSVDKGALVSF